MAMNLQGNSVMYEMETKYWVDYGHGMAVVVPFDIMKYLCSILFGFLPSSHFWKTEAENLFFIQFMFTHKSPLIN